MDGNALGTFLRARRALVRPEDVRMPASGTRRVAGLRREEVAELAGVSTDYYTRLEQGREKHPSEQVLDALAGVLRLEEDAVAHLRGLARPAPRARRRAVKREQVSTSLLRMLESWPDTPALVLNERFAVLGHNALGRALFAGHEHSDDLVRLVFLDPDASTFYPDWEKIALNTVAGLRASADASGRHDAELVDLVGELSLKSAAFRRLWARHDVRRKSTERKRFNHPLVGALELTYEALTVNSAPGQQLAVYQADPGSRSAEALGLLGSLAASEG
ncbi:helix-turn-helix transcriptional regulator [Actinosynnema pretiosum]|uniref:Transcriptional regulator n=1 Tax=Actinosynnema pretiosum TaxID=42197 RepID=A0A290Z4P8_9PSEU|nr:helix-turn-helix transcriptional regulator [Actinosynnema pretiosum]ATE53996.1 transcriptional regulator [Actinosynnema pretiosum]